MPEKPFAFTKEERLCSRKTIEQVFVQGKTMTLHPFRLLWICESAPSIHPIQVAFTVSKRNFKKAVARNLIKRRMREAYRKNKTLLYGPLNENKMACSLIIIYVYNEILKYHEIETLLVKSFQKLIPLIEKRDERNTD